MLKIKIKRFLWRFCGLGYKKFSRRSLVYKPLMIQGKKYISLGNRVTIRNNARIELIDRWKEQKFNPSLEIGDNTSFEQNLHLTCTSVMKIGSNCVFSSNVYISDCSHSIDVIDTNVLNNDLISKEVSIGNNCFIGIGAKILPGVSLGDNVIVGAGAVVNKSFPAYTMIAGVPAKIIKKYDFTKNQWISI